MSDDMTFREQCIEAGRDAMGRSSSWRWWAPRHLIRLLDLWEPMIRADEARVRGRAVEEIIEESIVLRDRYDNSGVDPNAQLSWMLWNARIEAYWDVLSEVMGENDDPRD